MSVIYHYWRHHSQDSMELDTLFEALSQAKYHVDYNEAAPDRIVLEDGTVMDYEEILERSGHNNNSGPIVDGSLVEN